MSPSTSVWIVSRRFDGFWFHAGLWLLPLLVLSTLVAGGINLLLVVMTLPFWLGHRFATLFTAFFLPAYRRLLIQHKERFFLWPILTYGAVAAFVFLPPEALLPLEQKIEVLAALFFAINTYHFSMQHFGLITIYQMKAGQRVEPAYRNWQKTCCLLLGGLLVAVGQILTGAKVVEDTGLYGLLRMNGDGAPLWVKIPATALVLTLLALWLVRERRLAPTSMPKQAYILALGLQSLLAFVLPPVAFLIVWGAQHWLVSIGLTTCMAARDHSSLAARDLWYRSSAKLRGNYWGSVVFLGLFSALLMPVFYRAVATHPAADAPTVLVRVFELLQGTVLLNCLVTLAFASVYVHFIYDRAIFRFSNPEVRAITGPLLLR